MPVYPLLALLWALVLVPPMVRGRIRHHSELAEFDRMRLCFVGATDVVSQERSDPPPAPIRRTAAQRRRRVLALIGAAIGATFVVALVVGTRLAWGLHLAVYDVLIGYVGLLARSRDRGAIRSAAPPVLLTAPAAYREPPAEWFEDDFEEEMADSLPELMEAVSR